MDPFKNSENRIFLSDGAATPAYSEIPVASLTYALNKRQEKMTTNADVDASGTLWGATANTEVNMTYEGRTMRFSDGEATPAVLDVLATLEELSEMTSPDDYADFLIVPNGKDPYTCQCSVDDVKGWGGDVGGLAEYTFKLTQQGPPTAYEGSVPARNW